MVEAEADNKCAGCTGTSSSHSCEEKQEKLESETMKKESETMKKESKTIHELRHEAIIAASGLLGDLVTLVVRYAAGVFDGVVHSAGETLENDEILHMALDETQDLVYLSVRTGSECSHLISVCVFFFCLYPSCVPRSFNFLPLCF